MSTRSGTDRASQAAIWMAALIVLGLIFGKGDWSHFKSAASASSTMAAAPSGMNLMIAFGVAPPVARDDCPGASELHLAGDFAEGGNTTVDFAHFVHIDSPAVALDLATVGDLAA